MNVHINCIEDVAAGIALARRGYDRKTHFRRDGDSFEMFHLDVCEKCGKKMVGANPVCLWKVPSGLIEAAVKVLEVQGMKETDIRAEGGCNDAGEIVCWDCSDEN